MKEIEPLSPLHGTVKIPGSKSITHRAVIASGLAKEESSIKNYLECEDTLHTIEAMRELGAEIFRAQDNLRITGTGGKLNRVPARKELFFGNSGTSFRLLLSIVALGRGEFLLTGSERMLERPIGPLVHALNHLGVEAWCREKSDCPPVLVKACGIDGGRVQMAGNQSSQFVSSLLFAGPFAEKDMEIEIVGDLVSKPYVDMTLDVMAHFGVRVERDGYRYFRVRAGQEYKGGEMTVEGDVSSASYFWAAAAVTGGGVTTENIYPLDTRQGDIRFLDLLEAMGCRIERRSDHVTVQGGTLTGIDVDMGAMPDMVPTLAAVALFSAGKTTIRNVHHLRFKESDRLRAVATEWKRLGGRVEEVRDGLIVHGGGRLHGDLMDPHNDHRLAMSLAVVGLRVPDVKIRNEGCVAKSFPRFWDLWDGLCRLS